MARTKKSKTAEGRRQIREREEREYEARQQKNYPIFGTMKAVTLPESTANDESDDESMDLDESGGVSVDLSSFMPMQSDTNITAEVNESEMKELYLQHPLEALNQTGNLWVQPPANSLHRKAARDNVHLKIPFLYNQCCRLITRHWRRDFNNWIPDEMRDQTPFSLALLIQLRKLASHTKQNYTLAQAAMLRVWHERIGDMQDPNPEWPYQFVETHPQIDKECESSIQENVYGLMMVDLQNALQQAKHPERHDLPRKKVKVKGQGQRQTVGEQYLAIQKKVKKARIEKRERKAVQQRCQGGRNEEKERDRHALDEPPRTQPQNVAVAPPTSPVMQTSKKFSALSDQFTLSIRTRSQLTIPPEMPHAEATEDLSRQDKENYESIADLITKMGVKHKNRPGKKRLRRLAAEGILSRRDGGVALPSERVDLGGMGALPAVESDEVSGGMSRLADQDIPH